MKKITSLLSKLSPGLWVAMGIMAVQVPALISGGFGYFRDEFYYIACSDHLAWGYIDHPPLSIFLLKLNRVILGDSLLALRLLPALAVAGLAWLSARLSKEMGGSLRKMGLDGYKIGDFFSTQTRGASPFIFIVKKPRKNANTGLTGGISMSRKHSAST